MKKILFLIPLFLLAFTSKYTPDLNNFLQPIKCDEVLHKTAFDICYNCSHKEPNVVAYVITKKMIESYHYSRKHLPFRTDYELPRKCRAYSNFYTHGGYDRGHYAPNGAFNYNRAIQKQTFRLSNIAPQAKWLNRRYWADVEIFARDKAVKYGKVEVITGSCKSKGHLKHNVNIPAYWYKIIYIPQTNNYIAFLAPNTNTGMRKAKVKEYRATIEKIKEVCNF